MTYLYKSNNTIIFKILISLCIVSCSSDNEINSIDDSKLIFLSTPIPVTDHNRTYQYQILVENNTGISINYSISKPNWLIFDETSSTLIGIPDWSNLNKSFNISILVFNDIETITQTFNLQVNLGEIICETEFEDPSTSSYILPFLEGKSFLLNQGYCPSNASWGHHNWFAYDFEMPIGTDILAMRSGIVIAIKESFADGTRICGEENYIFIRHDDGSVASYYHLTQNGVNVELNQQVQQGDTLGYSGDSGCSIGPHLHIAVFREQGNYSRQYSLPINFSNYEGVLNNKKGLIYNNIYKAL